MLILALDAGCATGALGDAHSVLGLGFAAIAGLSSRYPILIGVGDSGIARMRVDSDGAIGALSHAHSIIGLGCRAVAGLRSCYPVLVLVDDGSFARIRVGYNGGLTIAGRSKKQTCDHQ